MKKKVVILGDNMLDANEMEIFQAEIPYVVWRGKITNENNLSVSLNDIWVNFRVEFVNS